MKITQKQLKAGRQILNWLLYGNVFIAVCAMAYTLLGYRALHLMPLFDKVMIMSGTATLFVYLLIRIAATGRINRYEEDERWQFLLRHGKWLKILAAVALLATAIIYFTLPADLKRLLLLPALISVLYGIPLPIGKRLFRLRDLGVSKIFFISFVWAFISSFLPAAHAQMPVFSTAVWLLFAANFLFIFAITLPFDLKDMDIDLLDAVHTLPHYLGTENTYSLSFVLLFISGMIHTFLQRSILHDGHDLTIPFTVSILITGLCIHFSSKKNAGWIYFGLIDGMILLQYILIAVYPY